MKEVGGEHQGVLGTVANMSAHAHLEDPGVDRSFQFFERDQKSKLSCANNVI